MKTTLLSSVGWLGKIVIYTKKIFCCVYLILFNLNFTFILTLSLTWFFILFSEDVQKNAVTLCRAYITQQKISELVSA